MKQGSGLIVRLAVSRYSDCTAIPTAPRAAVDCLVRKAPAGPCVRSAPWPLGAPTRSRVAPSLGVPPSVGSAECGHEVPTGA